MLRQRHPGIGRHFKAAKFDQTQPAGGAIGGIKLVDTDFGTVSVAGDIDQEVAQQPVGQPWRRYGPCGRYLLQRHFQFIKRIMAGLVDPWCLRRGADEQAGKQIAERGVARPVQDQAAQQIGAAQERAIVRAGTAHNHMVAATGAGMAAIDHELVGPQTAGPCFGIHGFRDGNAFGPIGGGVDVHLDYARIGGDADHVQAGIMRRGVAFDMDRNPQFRRSGFGGGDQVQIILDLFDRWHEDTQPPVARFHRQGSADLAINLGQRLFIALLDRFGSGETGDLCMLGTQCDRIGQRAAIIGGVSGLHKRKLRLGDMGQAAQRQAVACGAVARHQKQLAAPERPLFRQPAAARPRLPALHRQHKAGGFGQATTKDTGDAGAFLGVFQFGIFRCHVFGQVAFAQDPFRRVFIGGHHVVGCQPQLSRDAVQQGYGACRGGAQIGPFGGDQRRVGPHRFAITPPIQAEGPARQAFTGIPFALTVMQEPTGGKAVAQAADQLVGKHPFGRADSFGVPFRGFKIEGRDEGRLPPHGQAHIPRRQCGIDLLTHGIQIGPGAFRIGFGDAGVFGDAGDRHVKGEIHLGIAGHTRNRRGVAVMRGGGQRDVAFTGEQARGGVKADPARAGQIHLAPGVQVGEIDCGAGRAVQRHQIGFQLDQIARDKAGGKAQMAQRLHQQP